MALRSDPKPETPRSKEYLDFVRKLPCSCCGAQAPSDPHHIAPGRPKASDYLSVPMCRLCHRELHDRGAKWMRENRAFSIREEAMRAMHLWITGQGLGRSIPREH